MKNPSKKALDSDFITRKTSQLTGRMFLLLNTIELANFPKNSLQDQCLWLKDHFGVQFKKQSLDERYNTHSVTFLRHCFENLLSHWFVKEKPQGLTTPFNRILLRDSSTWQLPAALSTFYPSKSSSKTGASIKIDYCLNYLDGKIEQLVLESRRVPDAKINTEHMPSYKSNDLIVNDLAYWNYKVFKNYDKIGAYFVSRLKTDASLFDTETDESIALMDVLPKDNSMVSFNCFLAHPKTHKGAVPVRVCIEKVPQSVKEQRLEKLQKTAKSQQWNLSELRIKLCGYNLYVTNRNGEPCQSRAITIITY